MNKSVLCSLACKLNQLSDQANCCLGSHFRDHWMVHVNSHKLRRVTYERTPAVNVIQNLFSLKLQTRFFGVTQELFVAAGALWSIATSSSSPEKKFLHENCYFPNFQLFSPNSAGVGSPVSVLRQFLGDCQEYVVHV